MTTPPPPSTAVPPQAPVTGVKRPRSRLARFRASRGVAKFRRNRLAMFSLFVIGLFIALSLWISLTEVADWVGRRTRAYELRKSPVLSLFLPTEIARRVGPPRLAGFGAEQSAPTRTTQYTFLYEAALQALKNVGTLTSESTRTPRQVLDESSMMERGIADLPLEDLQGLLQQLEEKFARLDNLKRRANAMERARIAAEQAQVALQGWRQAVRTGEPEDELKRLRTEVLNQTEGMGYAVGDHNALDKDATVFSGIDTAEIEDLAFSVEDGDDPGEALDAVLASVLQSVSEGRASFDAPTDEALAEIRMLTEQLWPQPTGLRGVIYRFRTLLGTDLQGRSLLVRALYSAKIALQVGFVVAIISVCFGAVVGAAAAYFGGWVDHAVIWIYSTLSSIPYLVLLSLLAFVFQTSSWVVPWDPGTKISATLIPLYAAFCATFWIGPCRVIRGETMKLKQLEYVQAATAIGFGRFSILLRHVLPNTAHLMFINMSLLLIAAIKSEVVLTFLGLGLKEGASWGLMIASSRPDVVAGFFWQIGAATFFMFVLVLAFNIVSDALQDAFDPRHVG